jgi:hypothetical protein
MDAIMDGPEATRRTRRYGAYFCLECRSRVGADELVGIEGQNAIPVFDFANEIERGSRSFLLVICAVPIIIEKRDGRIFKGKPSEDFACVVRRLIVNDEHSVDEDEVVANERLDDVCLILHERNRCNAHFQISPQKGEKTRNNLIAFAGPLRANIVAKGFLVSKRKFFQSPMVSRAPTSPTTDHWTPISPFSAARNERLPASVVWIIGNR